MSPATDAAPPPVDPAAAPAADPAAPAADPAATLLALLATIETSDPMRDDRAKAAASMFRGHGSLEEAVETFEIALAIASRSGWRARSIPLRFPFEVQRFRARLLRRRRRGPRAKGASTGRPRRQADPPAVTPAALACLLVAMGAAIIDWVAVGTRRQRLEYVAKPTVMVALLGLAIALVPGSSASQAARPWFVAALALSLVGDVLLMLPRERFVGGLVAFLLAHLAYIVGLVAIVIVGALVVVGVAVGLLVVASTVLLVGWPIVRAIRVGRPRLVAPVVAYLAVISSMVVVACATGRPVAIAGALLFYASDAILAWDRFVMPKPWGRVGTHVTYHTGQTLLVLSLLG